MFRLRSWTLRKCWFGLSGRIKKFTLLFVLCSCGLIWQSKQSSTNTTTPLGKSRDQVGEREVINGKHGYSDRANNAFKKRFYSDERQEEIARGGESIVDQKPLNRRFSNSSVPTLLKMKKSSGATHDSNSARPVPVLSWWSSTSTQKRNRVVQCGERKCRVKNGYNSAAENSVDAYLFYGTTLEPYDLPIPRNNKQIWALFHEESPKNGDFIFSFEETMGLFNLTATSKRQSDMPTNTFYLESLADLTETKFLVPTTDKDRYRREEGLAPVVFVQSDCHPPSDRDNFVKMLQKHIQVDSYGRCLHNKDLPESLRFNKNMAPLHSEDFVAFLARYKFTLSMENCVCDDYVTEKLWRTFRTGSVPIAFGPPNIKDYLPTNKSALIIDEFNSVEELANRIKFLDQHPEEYDKYLRYKRDGITNTRLVEEAQRISGEHKSDFFTSFECFVCEETHKFRSDNSIRKVANVTHYGCPEPRRFDALGKYRQEGGPGSVAFHSGSQIAKAMRHFYDKGLKVPRHKFFNFARFL